MDVNSSAGVLAGQYVTITSATGGNYSLQFTIPAGAADCSASIEFRVLYNPYSSANNADLSIGSSTITAN
jgi:hypothetical protein